MQIKSKIFLSNPVKKGEKSRIIADIFVDDVSELPAPDALEDYELSQGSIAYVIKSGELYVMSNDGEWYNSDTTEEL